MNPQACFQLFLQSIADRDTESACEHFDNLREWIGKGGFPPDDVRSIADDLSDAMTNCETDPDGETFLDFRIYLTDDGSYRVCIGDPSYDTDHRGYCGAGSLDCEDEDCDTIGAVLDCIDDALEVFSQSV
jgi:hypothetical protein